MKILQVTTVASTLNAFLLPFAQAFKEQGWVVDAAAENIEKFPLVIKQHNQCFNINFSRNPKRIGKIYESFISIRKLIKEQKYDVVHVHTPIAAFLTRIASIGIKGTKVFYTAHGFHYVKGNPLLKNVIFFTLEKLAGYFTEHLFVINKDDYQLAKKFKFVKEKNLTFIRGIGVSTNQYHFQQSVRDKIRSELNDDSNDLVLLQIAELNKNKNHKVVIGAIANLRKENKSLPFKLFIIGTGSEEERLKHLVEKLGLQDYVNFLGYRRDVPDLLCAADAVVLSSLREGLPRCLLEAMCLKLPIVASNIRGCRDLLEGGAGILVDPDDINGWEIALTSLLISDKRSDMGRKGYAMVNNEYSLESVIESVISVYQKV